MINPSDLNEIKEIITYASKDDIKLLEVQIRYLDSKTDIMRNDINLGISRLMAWMMGSFALVFAVLGYLVFKN